jgi:hypothetical protein
MRFKPNRLQLLGHKGVPTHGIRTPSIPKQIVGPEKSGNLADSLLRYRLRVTLDH